MSRIVVLGDLNLDILATLPEELPSEGEVRSPIQAMPGGSAGNFARAAAREGAEVTFIGCVGNDLVGDLLVRSLQVFGVDTRVKRVGQQSGMILSLVKEDGKTMICSRGANDGLDPSWLEEGFFVNVDHLHLSGYGFLSPAQRGATHRAIEIAHSLDLTISIDPPPANLIRNFGIPAFLAEISTADFIFPNLDEGKVLSGKDDEGSIVDALAERFPLGALTLGEAGSLAWHGKERNRCVSRSITTIDATGAGDAFAAGFVISYLEVHDLARANHRGNKAASQVLKGRGHLADSPGTPAG
ncbi:MAG: carbohydrate kinase family protein [Candidatus Bipolaricaulota bacterium]|nr:carbohydrate kinase family protein [Candidatus Bipolaricaulota bacterium]